MAGETAVTSLKHAARPLDAGYAFSLALAMLVGSFGQPARGDD